MKTIRSMLVLLLAVCSLSSWASLPSAVKEEAYIRFNSKGLVYLKVGKKVEALAEHSNAKGETYKPLSWEEFSIRVISLGKVPTLKVYRQVSAAIHITNNRIKRKSKVKLSDMRPEYIDKYWSDKTYLIEEYGFTQEDIDSLKGSTKFVVYKADSAEEKLQVTPTNPIVKVKPAVKPVEKATPAPVIKQVAKVEPKQKEQAPKKTEKAPSTEKKAKETSSKETVHYGFPMLADASSVKSIINKDSGSTVAFSLIYSTVDDISALNIDRNNVVGYKSFVIPLRQLSEEELRAEMEQITAEEIARTKANSEVYANQQKGHKMQATGALQPQSPFTGKQHYLFAQTDDITEEERSIKYDLFVYETYLLIKDKEKNYREFHFDPSMQLAISTGETFSTPLKSGQTKTMSFKETRKKLKSLGAPDITWAQYQCNVDAIEKGNSFVRSYRKKHPKAKNQTIHKAFLAQFEGNYFPTRKLGGKCGDKYYIIPKSQIEQVAINSAKSTVKETFDAAIANGEDPLTWHLYKFIFHADKRHMAGLKLTLNMEFAPKMTKAERNDDLETMFKQGYANSNLRGDPTNDIRNIFTAELLYRLMTPEQQARMDKFMKKSVYVHRVNNRVIQHWSNRIRSIYYKENEGVVKMMKNHNQARKDIAYFANIIKKQDKQKDKLAKN